MDKVQARLAAIGHFLGQAKSVTVGYLKDGPTYPARESQAQTDSNADRASMGVAPAESPSKPVAMIAAIQNYGSAASGIPPRPFFTLTVDAGKAHWGTDLAKLLRENSYDSRVALELMGERIKGELATAIVDLTAPPLAPYTIAKKGSDKPLIETGLMLNSLDHAVA